MVAGWTYRRRFPEAVGASLPYGREVILSCGGDADELDCRILVAAHNRPAACRPAVCLTRHTALTELLQHGSTGARPGHRDQRRNS
jgi:hypothetical protein